MSVRFIDVSHFYNTPCASVGYSGRMNTHTTARAQCAFSVQSWDEQPFSDVDGQLKLTHASVKKTFQGDLEGEGTLRYLMFYGAQDQTRVIGLERIQGKLGGKTGSFVLEHTGGDDGSQARGQVTVLPGSGTGELASLRGSGEAVATRTGDYHMTLDYELD
jgi:hypothetical protein